MAAAQRGKIISCFAEERAKADSEQHRQRHGPPLFQAKPPLSTTHFSLARLLPLAGYTHQEPRNRSLYSCMRSAPPSRTHAQFLFTFFFDFRLPYLRCLHTDCSQLLTTEQRNLVAIVDRQRPLCVGRESADN